MMLTSLIIKLNVAQDFSRTPGGRYAAMDTNSAEEFRDLYLWPRFQEAREKGAKLEINLDGGYGFANSFLEEAFGGLRRKYGVSADEMLSTIVFVCEEEPYRIKEIRRMILAEY